MTTKGRRRAKGNTGRQWPPAVHSLLWMVSGLLMLAIVVVAVTALSAQIRGEDVPGGVWRMVGFLTLLLFAIVAIWRRALFEVPDLRRLLERQGGGLDSVSRSVLRGHTGELAVVVEPWQDPKKPIARTGGGASPVLLSSRVQIVRSGDFGALPAVSLELNGRFAGKSRHDTGDRDLDNALDLAVGELAATDFDLQLEIRPQGLRVVITGGSWMGSHFGHRIAKTLDFTERLLAGLEGRYRGEPPGGRQGDGTPGAFRPLLTVAGALGLMLVLNEPSVAQPVTAGVGFLLDRQQADGSWTSGEVRDVQATASALQAMQAVGAAPAAQAAAAGFLEAGAVADSDDRARRVAVLAAAGADVSALVAELLADAEPSGGWGLTPEFAADPLDTALVLTALARTGQTGTSEAFLGLVSLVGAQNDDGGWPCVRRGDSDVACTARALSALALYRTIFRIDAQIGAAAGFLLSQVRADGGIGAASEDSVFNTASAARALLAAGEELPGHRPQVQSYLEAAQAADGSWSGDPHLTAEVVLALQTFLSTPFCGDGAANKPGEACDGLDLAGATCEDVGFGPGDLACSATCTYDTAGCSPPPVCGDGEVNRPEEACDGLDLAGQTCESLGFDSGDLACADACAFDTSACAVPPLCGDGLVNQASEVCDGADLMGQSCESLDLGTGTLGCTFSCRFDTADCSAPPVCGDGVINGPTERCDGQDLAGLTCEGFGGFEVADLADDWSDTQNPNGAWSYTGNAGAFLPNNFADWDPTGGCCFPSPQPAWAATQWPNPGHVPMWFKANAPSALDVPVGRVGMHGSAAGTTQFVGVVWTSSFFGSIDVSGGVWFAAKVLHQGRSANWRLRINDTVLTEGTVAWNDAFDSSAPADLSAGSGGPAALLDIVVAPGDRLVLEFISPQSIAPFVGVDVTIRSGGTLACLTNCTNFDVAECTDVPDADMDGFPAGADCDDDDPEVNPGQEEIPLNLKDDDCDLRTPDVLAECSVEVVFTMDTSGSMSDDAAALCTRISQVESGLAALGVDAQTHLLGISETRGGSFSCLTDHVQRLLGGTVPGDDGACDGFLNQSESWGQATAIVADRFPWAPGAIRVIVPISDEGPCNGDSCIVNGSDRDAIANGAVIAAANDVFVSPIVARGANSCVSNLATLAADETGGTVFFSVDPGLDLSGAIADLLIGACEETLTVEILPADAVNPVSTAHAFVATVTDALGIPQEGREVSAEIVSGPNAGGLGAATTAADGGALFEYTSGGEVGVDEIVASVVDNLGRTVNSSPALKFWDEDCNENGIADTCDLDCGGFATHCGIVMGCGMSADVNGDASPDECLLPDTGTDEDGDGYPADVDCDDTNPDVNPGADEIPGNGIDDDCNPATPDEVFDGAVNCDLVADQIIYDATDSVALEGSITNSDNLLSLTGLLATLVARDSGGGVVYHETRVLAPLAPGGRADQVFRFPAASHAPGVYQAELTISAGGEALAVCSTEFSIGSSADTGAGLTGIVTFDPKVVNAGDSSDLIYTVSNGGNATLADLGIKVVIVDPSSEEIVGELVDSTTLDPNGFFGSSQAFSTADLPVGDYIGVLIGILASGDALTLDDAVLTVVNVPPDCTGAVADPDELWPPDHAFVDIGIEGVVDPDGDPVTLTVNGVFQDESTDSTGDGAFCPDAVATTSQAALRRERSGNDDGRVYHIQFTADDGRGGTCEGEVTVCVPHDRRAGSTCVDQGALFDSTICP